MLPANRRGAVLSLVPRGSGKESTEQSCLCTLSCIIQLGMSFYKISINRDSVIWLFSIVSWGNNAPTDEQKKVTTLVPGGAKV